MITLTRNDKINIMHKLQNKKILFDARFLATHHGGLARYCRELLKEMLTRDTGINWVVLVREDEEFPEDLKEIINKSKNNIEVVGTNIVHYTVKEQTEYLKLIEDLKPDLVHFTNFNHPVRIKKPFVITLHDLTLGLFPDGASWLKRKLYDYVVRHATEEAKLIFTVSEFSKKTIHQKFDVPPARIQVTYNGIDLDKFRPISNGRRLQEVARKYKIKKQYILYVGQWASHKNLPRLLEAFQKLENDSEFKGQYELVIVGRPRVYYDQIVGHADKLGIRSSVVLPGFVGDDDLPALYNGARLFAFPSLMEGFGIPPLEAMACGTPVISSKETSLPEVLEDAAYFFNPLHVDDIFEALKVGLTDDGLRRELSEKGIIQARKYIWSKTADETLRGYGKVL